MSSGVRDEFCWLSVDVEDGIGVALKWAGCETIIGCLTCWFESKEEVAEVSLLIGPQSSSHAGLLFEEERGKLGL